MKQEYNIKFYKPSRIQTVQKEVVENKGLFFNCNGWEKEFAYFPKANSITAREYYKSDWRHVTDVDGFYEAVKKEYDKYMSNKVNCRYLVLSQKKSDVHEISLKDMVSTYFDTEKEAEHFARSQAQENGCQREYIVCKLSALSVSTSADIVTTRLDEP